MPIYDIETKELEELDFDWVFPTSQETKPMPNRDTFLSQDPEDSLDPSQVAESTSFDLFCGGTSNNDQIQNMIFASSPTVMNLTLISENCSFLMITSQSTTLASMSHLLILKLRLLI